MIDFTHNPKASSWVVGADSHADFPVQNLPLGVFSTSDTAPRVGIAIGAYILDLAKAEPLLNNAAQPALEAVKNSTTLNALFACKPSVRLALRYAVFTLLTDKTHEKAAQTALIGAEQCQMHMPLTVRDFTDFYAGIHHASAVGALLRPENPLLPNYKYIPVGYHGRASSMRISGTSVVRPRGQVRAPDSQEPHLAPCQKLDYEVELGIWIGGTSQLGHPISIAQAHDHIAGLCLLNDWSARDIQAWEYQPLGPFLAKNFATTISPWIITTEALAPFRVAAAARASEDPAPLPYLYDTQDQQQGAFDIQIQVSLETANMRATHHHATQLGHTAATYLYWTPAQMIAHHSVNGCDLSAGDVFGTGTISGPQDTQRGSLMELSRGGRQPITLPNGETRSFLEDGDSIIMTGWAEREGYRRIGFGTCRATISPAL